MLFASIATAIAGFLDAIGYQQLNHLYVSFMSGNSTHLGMSFAQAKWSDVLQAFYVISAFVAGSAIGTLISDALERPLLALILSEIALCCVSAFLAAIGFGTPALLLIGLTMGMQNVMHQNVSGTDVGKGFITGALFGFGQAIGHAFKKSASWSHARVHGCSWISFITGVIGGTIFVSSVGVAASLGFACVGLLAMTALVVDTAVSCDPAGGQCSAGRQSLERSSKY
ncbi:hypothetical protein ASE04_11330 [Rhizobium sp. Root708]|nr:hypothetical protein ASE04_11330 [Rhizobium sp. Root708]